MIGKPSPILGKQAPELYDDGPLPLESNADITNPLSLPSVLPQLEIKANGAQSTPSENEIAAIIRAQSRVRRILATCIKEEKADVPALRNANGQVIAYKVKPETDTDGKKQYPWVAFPEPACDLSRHGVFKALTHENDNYVGFTLKNPDKKTVSEETLMVLNRYNFIYIIAQIRVNKTQLISKNLGASDLSRQITIERKKFTPAAFQPAAKELQRLHSFFMVHRDIKPENMMVDEDGNVVIVDLDFMGKVGNFRHRAGTPTYLPGGWMLINVNFWGEVSEEFHFMNQFAQKGIDNKRHTEKINPYKKDQYAFLKSAAEAILGIDSKTFLLAKQTSVTGFIKSLPCSARLKENVLDFFTDPINVMLSSRLEDYFTSPSSL